jgi:hypothetical protein
MYYARIQFFSENQGIGLMTEEKLISNSVEAMNNLCRIFEIKVLRHYFYVDMYYLIAPTNPVEFSHFANVLNAFCYHYFATWRLVDEPAPEDTDKFLENLANEKFDE